MLLDTEDTVAFTRCTVANDNIQMIISSLNNRIKRISGGERRERISSAERREQIRGGERREQINGGKRR